MLIFLLASGLTLIFGLMSVLNFAHGGLFAWGAFSGIWFYGLSGSFFIGILGAILTGAVLGFITEKLIITPCLWKSCSTNSNHTWLHARP